MYIGTISIDNTWSSVEALVQAQVDPNFAFASNKTYQLQSEGTTGLRFVDGSAIPTGERDGERITATQVAIYEKDTGTLYVKSEANDNCKQTLKISELA